MLVNLSRKQSLRDLEKLLIDINSDIISDIDFHVPRDFGAQLFKDTWIVALLATATQRMCAKGGRIAIRAWSTPEGSTKSEELTKLESPLDLASAVYSNIGSKSSTALSAMAKKTVNELQRRQGLVVFHGANQILAVFALDPEAPLPIVLGDTRRREPFLTEFKSLKRKYLEVGDAAGFSSRHPDLDSRISELALELFQNTLQHGRYSANNDEISGLRYLHLLRHIGHSRESFISRATEFPELRTYLTTVVPERGTRTFLEMVVSDTGIGLVDRFLSTRRDLNIVANTPKLRLGVINRIIGERLSSKINDSGAGSGIRNALSALAQLQGFVSLRSGTEWVFRDYASGHAGPEHVLMPVGNSEHLSRIAGTHYNLLLPLS